MGLDINGESSKNIWPSYFTPSEKEGLVNHLPDEILIKIFNYILQVHKIPDIWVILHNFLRISLCL